MCRLETFTTNYWTIVFLNITIRMVYYSTLSGCNINELGGEPRVVSLKEGSEVSHLNVTTDC